MAGSCAPPKPSSWASTRALYQMRDTGLLDQLARGLYRLAELPPPAHPDLITVALRVPQAVICLISALSFHNLTTQIPHVVDVALPRGSARPRLKHPPLRVFLFSGPAWKEGAQIHNLDKTPVRIYGPDKTLADCFKYRRRLGLDVAVEALRTYLQQADVNVDRLMHYARVCRVQEIIQPYLEALL